MAVDIFAPHIVKLDRSLITDIENDVDKQEYYFYYRDSFHKRGTKCLLRVLNQEKSMNS